VFFTAKTTTDILLRRMMSKKTDIMTNYTFFMKHVTTWKFDMIFFKIPIAQLTPIFVRSYTAKKHPKR